MHALTRSLAVLFFFSGYLSVHGQEATGETPLTVSVQFRLFAWGTEVPPLVFGSNQKTETVEINTRSPIYHYSGPQVLNFTRPPKTPPDRLPPQSSPPSRCLKT